MTKYTKIKSIKPLGQRQTYDLTVNHPEHTFLCQGISVSNSYNHALSYSMISYQCAFLFTFFQDDWVASYLDTESAGSSDAKQKSILNVQKLGYDILLPDINKSDFKWRILEDNTLLAPFTMVKGMGEKSIAEVVNNQPFKNIEHFLFNSEISYQRLNIRKVKDLAKGGVLDSLKDNRFLNRKHFFQSIEMKNTKKVDKNNFNEIISFGKLTEKQFDLFAPQKQLLKLSDIEEYTKQEMLLQKIEILGYYDMKLILNDKRSKFLESNEIKNISTYSEDDSTVWFIPIEKTAKVSKTNKKNYVELTVLDDTFNKYRIYCFGIFFDTIELHNLYVAQIDSFNSFFGFTIFDANQKMTKL